MIALFLYLILYGFTVGVIVGTRENIYLYFPDEMTVMMWVALATSSIFVIMLFIILTKSIRGEK